MLNKGQYPLKIHTVRLLWPCGQRFPLHFLTFLNNITFFKIYAETDWHLTFSRNSTRSTWLFTLHYIHTPIRYSFLPVMPVLHFKYKSASDIILAFNILTRMKLLLLGNRLAFIWFMTVAVHWPLRWIIASCMGQSYAALAAAVATSIHNLSIIGVVDRTIKQQQMPRIVNTSTRSG